MFRYLDTTRTVVEEPGFAVDAYTKEAARTLVIDVMRTRGHRLRSVSHTTRGGFVAVTVPAGTANPHDPPPFPESPLPVFTRGGGWGSILWGGEPWGSPVPVLPQERFERVEAVSVSNA